MTQPLALCPVSYHSQCFPVFRGGISLHHAYTGPEPIFGLALACADRVRPCMRMRGPAGPEAKVNVVVLLLRKTIVLFRRKAPHVVKETGCLDAIRAGSEHFSRENDIVRGNHFHAFQSSAAVFHYSMRIQGLSLSSACLPARGPGRRQAGLALACVDRVQPCMRMRGPAGPEAKVNIVVLLLRKQLCYFAGRRHMLSKKPVALMPSAPDLSISAEKII